MNRFLFLLLLATLSALAAEPDLVVADFEGSDYGGWVATGNAFGAGPAHGALPGQMAVDGFVGGGLVNSFVGGDDSTGTLTSPVFKLQRPYLRFLIGGGAFEKETCLNLLIDQKIVRTATGPNKNSGGSEHLEPAQWDVSEFAGKEAILQIVDQRKGGWGHINVDQIVQTDQALPKLLTDASREIVAHHKYLNLPVKNGAPKKFVNIFSEGKLVRQFQIELADGEPDWWSFLDLKPFAGKKLTVQVDKLKEDSSALKSIEQSDKIRGGENVYREKLRPQFHFTAKRGWNNDPNGLVQYKGEYHLFYQHNPYGWNWGNMHWGHAVSADLVHWKELDEALYPDAQGTMFSGSGVVDENNTAGFQKGSEKPIVLMYTAAGNTSPQSKNVRFTQALAYSNDRGRTWTKYEKNPVLPHIAADNRDPKVLWYALGKKWLLALYLDHNDFAIFDSKDLKSWNQLCKVVIPGATECPEFFEIPIAGKNETRWIFYGGNGRYLVGRFDGKTFTPEGVPHELNRGNCFYASQTYNLESKDHRRILVPWSQINIPGMPFNQMIGLPVELTLRESSEGLRLAAWPIKEIEKLREPSKPIRQQLLRPGESITSPAQLIEIEAEFSAEKSAQLRFEIRGIPVSYDADKSELACLGKRASLAPVNGKVHLRLLVDRTSIDIFGNHGAVYMPMGAIFKETEPGLTITTRNAAVQFDALTIWSLKSAWK